MNTDLFNGLISEEAKTERATLRDIVIRVYTTIGALCAAFLILLAATWPTGANAAPVFKATQHGYPVVLRLLDKPCTNEKVRSHFAEKVAPSFHDKFKAAQLTYGGADWASCWVEVGGMVYSIDEEGAPLMPIPREAFKEETV